MGSQIMETKSGLDMLACHLGLDPTKEIKRGDNAHVTH